MAYIYKITNDINNKIYIGKTEFSIEKRFQEHCRDAFKERNEKRPLYAAIRKYGVEHFHIEIIEETDNPEEREVYWIEKYGSFKNGYNATMGGDGKKYLDYDLIIATYQEVQEIEQTAKICNCSVDSVRNILRAQKIAIISSVEITKKKYGKPISQFTLDNIFFQNFSSLADAARWLLENNYAKGAKRGVQSHIRDCANGSRKTAYGFIWKFSSNNV